MECLLLTMVKQVKDRLGQAGISQQLGRKCDDKISRRVLILPKISLDLSTNLPSKSNLPLLDPATVALPASIPSKGEKEETRPICIFTEEPLVLSVSDTAKKQLRFLSGICEEEKNERSNYTLQHPQSRQPATPDNVQGFTIRPFPGFENCVPWTLQPASLTKCKD